MNEQQAIIGGWRLVSFENYDGEGRVRLPYGPVPVGYILYTGEGRMSATIMRGDRTPIAGEPGRGARTAEKACAFEEYLSYAGRYTFLGDRVIHHVEVALWPGWVGTDLLRLAEFNGDRLILRTASSDDDTRSRTTIITWQRVATA